MMKTAEKLAIWISVASLILATGLSVVSLLVAFHAERRQSGDTIRAVAEDTAFYQDGKIGVVFENRSKYPVTVISDEHTTSSVDGSGGGVEGSWGSYEGVLQPCQELVVTPTSKDLIVTSATIVFADQDGRVWTRSLGQPPTLAKSPPGSGVTGSSSWENQLTEPSVRDVTNCK
jgi:hypothetical protein